MRSASGLAGVLICCSLAQAAPEESFPYTAYVRADDVYVRSGPGRNYYPTDKLAKHDAVEVWRHDPGGWLAIRPPEGSFSWVSTRYLRPIGDGLGVITGERVVSRVGSGFSEVRDVIQVRLGKGEKVVIVDERETAGDRWYKIAPPAGEFRWISAQFVSRQPPHNGVSRPLRGRKLSAHDRPATAGRRRVEPRRDEAIVLARDAAAAAEPEARVAEVEPAVYWEDASEPASVAEEYDERERRTAFDERQGSGRRRKSDVEPVQYAVEHDGVSRRRSRRFESRRSDYVASRAPSRIDSDPRRRDIDFAAELADIELRISQMVAEEPTVWSFARIRDRLELLLDEAPTAIERGRVRNVLNRLATFEDIRERYAYVADVMAQTDRRNAALGSPGGTRLPIGSRTNKPAVPTAARLASTASFDGKGILKPVISKRTDAPRFALVDDLGDVTSFVTPAPGVNLQPYVGRHVGLVGTRGYMPDLRKPHVMAKRVTVLR